MAAHNSPLSADLASLSQELRSWFFHYAAEFRMEARILIYGVQLLLGLLVDPLPPFSSAGVPHAAPSCLRFRPTQAATPHQIEPTMCKNLVYVKSWTVGAVVTDADGAVMLQKDALEMAVICVPKALCHTGLLNRSPYGNFLYLGDGAFEDLRSVQQYPINPTQHTSFPYLRLLPQLFGGQPPAMVNHYPDLIPNDVRAKFARLTSNDVDA
ncbi:hypothetical protein M427DRAFT_32235 [Gonapodya prolifera JEL478]|uniref:Uncharacterized protein n=1 Tax=Gonapodya prolifera (strain JEL478) TaxID=1344416 RepID=A0A139AFF3_GONPJ|nr:hypothetical protein M427DRAFT_32235 [Gonapodya prolifera JEL478]|eukprot:KXS15541.1 hypothetical protein M427DRAFT_32235 [Gonapodya prolifera JEL478]